MSEKITYEQALKALEDVAAAKPDYVYEKVEGMCAYADSAGSPSCIVGHVISKLDPEAFKQIVSVEWAEDYSYPDSMGVEDLDLDITQRTLTLLSDAQCNQDMGIPWGEAVEKAKSAANQVSD